MVALSFDVGLATCGAAVVRLHPREIELVRSSCFISTKSDKKRGVLSADDDLRRAEELGAWMGGLFDDVQPRVVVAERKSLPRNASAAGKISIAWGVLSEQRRTRKLPLVQASPQEVRRALSLPKGATKLDVQAAVTKGRPEVMPMLTRWLLEEFPGHTPRQRELMHEHPVDAFAAFLACELSEVVKAIRHG